MGILDFLLRRAPLDTDPAPEITISIQINESPKWTPEFETEPALIEETHAPESPPKPTAPMFCCIDYTDASGRRSRRRVTVRGISKSGGHTCVECFCHERNAPRSFRLDRVNFFFDEDGQIHDTEPFIRNVIAPTLGANVDGDPRYVDFVSYLTPALVILVAASRADNHVHRDETDAILIYTEREATALFDDGRLPRFPTIETFDSLKPVVAAMRPMKTDIARAVREISTWDESATQRLADAVWRVFMADGVLAPEEQQFSDDLRRLSHITDGTNPDLRPDDLKGAIFVFTGTLSTMTRTTASEHVKRLGAIVKTHVDFAHGHHRAFVVIGDKPGAKATKAIQSGIPTLTEAEFLRLIGDT